MKSYLFFFLILIAIIIAFTKTYNVNDCTHLCGDKNIKSCGWIKIECNAPEPILDCE